MSAEAPVDTTVGAEVSPAFAAEQSSEENRKRPSEFDDTAQDAEAKRLALTSEEGAPAATTSTIIAASGDAAAGAVAAEAPEEEIAMRALVDSKYAGSLIGRQGATISYIRQQSGARVNISDSAPGIEERVCTVTGTTAGVFRAYSFICDKLRESVQADATVVQADPAQPQPVQIRLLVPHAQAGAVIGKQGAKIKEIREATKAKVDLSPDCLPGSTERACTISGTAEAVAQTVFHVSCTLQQVGDRGQVMHFSPTGGAGGGGGGGGGGGFGGGQAPRGPPAHQGYPQQGYGGYPQQGYPQQGYGGYPQQGYGYPQQAMGQPAVPAFGGGGGGGGGGAAPAPGSHQVPVPNEFIGSIIGKKGSKINEIRTYSQAQIKIQDNVAGSTDRIISISGTPEAVQLAHYLIQQRVDEARNAPGAQIP